MGNKGSKKREVLEIKREVLEIKRKDDDLWTTEKQKEIVIPKEDPIPPLATIPEYKSREEILSSFLDPILSMSLESTPSFLPDGVLQEILRQLSPPDISLFCQTCKRWNQIGNSRFFWRQKAEEWFLQHPTKISYFRHDITLSEVEALDDENDALSNKWKQYFIFLHTYEILPNATALYSYDSMSDDELSKELQSLTLGFKEGDKLIIVEKDPGGWWAAELDGKRGYIPANYVEEIKEP